VTDLENLQELPRMQISGQPRRIIYPDCPDCARGNVSLQAFVDCDGIVNRVRALTGNRVLAAAATKAIRQWRYQPFSGNAQKLERETRITVSFISSDVVAVSFPRAGPVSQ
jgi:outer membrane biosynthesis protein TonB